MTASDLQLIVMIIFTIIICMGFFTLGVIIGIVSKRERLPEPKMPKVFMDATTALEKRIEELKNAPTQMRFNPFYKGIYTKGDI